ncbi:hypothetical protein DICVIV_07706 [Dictyocaulus viviparus]|uniref:WH2 domain-containing protein n=1 Tax=Dictyocaulus viviparus TaxID=29172 RepID=A0A0D8XR39_DICVI|nr:hypothetical protein DICVIV_07706 [Dictyocaulus viviparus]
MRSQPITQQVGMAPSPPLPPPAPPPPTLLVSSSNSVDSFQGKKPTALLADIQKGRKLRKVITNDRSAPQVGGKVSSPSVEGVTISSHLEMETKPVSGSGVRSGGSLTIGSLFVNGLPAKPSENKLHRINKSYTIPTATFTPSTSTEVSFVRPEINSPLTSSLVKPAEFSALSKPSPPPPPIQTMKPAINCNSSGREQFKTLRPMKSESNLPNVNLRRSGSSEDFPSCGSVPSRGPSNRPALHTPSVRPSAPPPPPPSIRINEGKTPEPPPPPAVGPVASTLNNRFGSSSYIINRGEENAPPPPPRTASKATSSALGSSLSYCPKFVNRDAHPLDRFTFKPLSSLPPPPILSQTHAP